jgi:hypothetical protein
MSYVLLALCPAIVIKAISPVKPLATITAEAGKYTRIDTPVSVVLDKLVDNPATSRLLLMEVKDSNRVATPAQIEAGNPAKLWWILTGTTAEGEKRIYELCSGEPAETAAVKAVKNDKALVIQKDNKDVLQYNHAIVPAPKDMEKVPEARRSFFNRSGFIHPLWSPSGDVLTEIHPADHIHHFGLWMPWTHTQYEGRLVDFWNIGDGTGTVRFAKYLSTTDGLVYGGFQAEQEHVALKTSQGEKVILREVWDVRVYNVGGTEKGYWLIDFKSTQRCVAEKGLAQDEYRYGGYGFRGTHEWKGETASYLTSEGKDRNNGNATRARWCDTSGAINGKWAGVVHISNPQNFRHPEPMRIWPEKENPLVFFGFAPSQLGAWEMEPGKDYIFQYRLYVHEGRVNVDDAERFWHDYAEPPTVTLTKAPISSSEHRTPNNEQ